MSWALRFGYLLASKMITNWSMNLGMVEIATSIVKTRNLTNLGKLINK